MAWQLKEHEQSMFKILEVVDESGKVIKTFVADKLTYSEKKKKAQLMAAAPELKSKYKKLAMAVVQMLNYMDMEHGDIVVSEYELNILESLIKKDFGKLVHNKYSNIGDGE